MSTSASASARSHFFNGSGESFFDSFWGRQKFKKSTIFCQNQRSGDEFKRSDLDVARPAPAPRKTCKWTRTCNKNKSPKVVCVSEKSGATLSRNFLWKKSFRRLKIFKSISSKLILKFKKSPVDVLSQR